MELNKTKIKYITMDDSLNITALIIDDDPMSRKHLKSSLDKLGKVSVLQVCESGVEDYLLKPVQLHLLQEALETAIEKIKSKRKPATNEPSAAEVTQPIKTLDSLAIPTLEGLLFIDVREIIWCESEGRYTNVCFADKKPIMASRNLAEFEELLTPAGFMRVHKSHLINLKLVKKYIRGEGGQVIMSNGKALDVGRSFKQRLLEKIEQFK